MINILFLLFLFARPLSADAPPMSVVVVGGGPAGLATAIEASQHGAHVTVVEKRKAYARAQSLFLLSETIDLLKQWNVEIPEMKVVELGESYRAQEGFVNLDSARQSTIEARGPNDEAIVKAMAEEEDRLGKAAACPNSPNLTERGINVGIVPIHFLEEGLKKRAVALGVKTIHAEFIRLENKNAIVCVQSDEQKVPYDVLVAADGAHSRARKELGISSTSFGKAVGIWTSMLFSEPQEFSISEPIEKDSFFIKKISFGPVSIAFAQTSAKDRISPQEFEKIVRGCEWKKEADRMAEGTARVSDHFEVVLQQAESFAKEERCAIMVGDASAAASFFQGLGANTALKTARIAGNFFNQLKTDKENAYRCFNKDMKTETDLLIEDSMFLFKES